MAARLTQSGKTPISERISIFEQKTPTTTSATPSPGRVQISITKKTVTTSRNFSAIKSQFNVTPSGEKNAGGSVRSASPVTPSPPSSLRSSAMSLNTSNPQISTPFKETPVPAARSTSVIKQPLVTQRSGSPTNKAQRTLSGQSKTSTTSTTTTPVKPQAATPLILNTSKPVSSPIRTFASNHSPSPPVVPSNNTFNYKYRTNSSSSSEPDSPEPGSDETDKVNGNLPPPSPSSSPPPLDNLNEWNKKNSFDIRRKSLTSTTTSVEKTTTTMSNKVTSVDHGSEVIEPSPVIIRTELDNVRSTKKSNNLNLKNNGTASTISASNNGGQVRSSYWTNQALQNDNAQKISEVNFHCKIWEEMLIRWKILNYLLIYRFTVQQLELVEFSHTRSVLRFLMSITCVLNYVAKVIHMFTFTSLYCRSKLYFPLQNQICLIKGCLFHCLACFRWLKILLSRLCHLESFIKRSNVCLALTIMKSGIFIVGVVQYRYRRLRIL